MRARKLYVGVDPNVCTTTAERIWVQAIKQHYCGVCQFVYRDEEAAEQCCTCTYCGEECGPREILHPACRSKAWAKQSAEKEIKALAAAEDVTDSYTGWVYADGWDGGFGEGYFPSLDDFLEHINSDEENIPEYVFCCHGVPLTLKSADYLIEECLEENEAHEGAWDHVTGAKALQVAVDAFNEANKDNITYFVDYTKKIRVKHG